MRRISFLIVGLLVIAGIVMAAETNLQSTKVIEGLKGQIGRAGNFILTRYEEATAPSTPDANLGIIYFKADGKAYSKSATAGEKDLTAGAGSGDVTKVGTPVDNQIGVWTGDGTIEGTSAFTFDGTAFRAIGTTIIQDASRIVFGTAFDVSLKWETEGNDNLQLGLTLGSADASGYYSIMEKDDISNANRSPLATTAYPILRMYGANQAEALHYGEFGYDGSNFVFGVGNGNFDFSSHKIISVTDPTNDQDAATKIYVDAATAAFNIDFFFNNTASDVGGIYFDMTSAALGGGESLLGAALSASTNDQAIANFLTDDTGGLGILAIPAGTFEIHYHAEKTAGNSTVNIYAEIYKRASGGAETLIVTSQTSGLVTSKAEFSLFAHAASDTNLLATDRIVVKFLANLGSGSGATVALYQEGTTVSRLAFPTTSEILNQIFLRQDGGIGTGVYDFGGADSFEIVNGTSPTVDAAGEIAVDTTDDQFVYYGSAKRVLSSSIPRSAVIENLKAADDGLALGMINEAITITSIGVHCDGTCTTPADIALSDRAGNAMTHTTPTVSTGTGNTTFVAVTSGNSLAAGEGLEFSVTNAVSPETDTYTISFTYTLDAQ